MTTHTLQGRYELRELIARGGMAQVWEAYDAVLKRSVAVKTVDLAGSNDSTLGPRLQREAVTLATLAHPDIVTVFDAGLEGETAYVVMELLEGRDLAAVISDGRVPVEEAARIGARVAGALAAAHEAGLVHRDVKPGNVLVHGAQVTVVDFGIAAATHAAETSMTTPGTILGTATYISPEQASGRRATPASDMYSFGCLLMALVTGTPPFAGEAPLALLNQHVSAEPARLADRVPDVPGRLDDLVHGLLDKDPAQRPSARETQQVLTELAGAPAVAAVAVPPDEARTQVLPAGAAGAGPAASAATADAAVASSSVLPATSVMPTTSVMPATSVMPTPVDGATPAGRPGDHAPSGAVRPPAGAPRSLPPRRPPGVTPPVAGRRRRPALIAAGVAVVLLAVLAFALGSNPPGGGTTPAAPAAEGEPAADAPADGGVAEAPAEELPAEAPAGEPPAEAPAEPPPTQDFPTLLSGMNLEESTRSDLLKRYEEAAASAAGGKPGKGAEKAGEKVAELSQVVAGLVADGEMAASDGQALTTALVTSFGTLPESGGGNGRGNDKKDDDD
ncbi:serine/threonine-protein kinase [Cellulomonas sp. S1-8]|uniref:serine/threonine-protein kinase n=1 Tax=Cellulomonas sp. S1-8 TaxID=2904790 RepID=UPI0022446BCA|nr:serine/threonine-protein kinase [Cellulomonas sp. S1-8]UZN03540.1 serine/threonine protein kinase [Cellulomonas sp. S1-8]